MSSSLRRRAVSEPEQHTAATASCARTGIDPHTSVEPPEFQPSGVQSFNAPADSSRGVFACHSDLRRQGSREAEAVTRSLQSSGTQDRVCAVSGGDDVPETDVEGRAVLSVGTRETLMQLEAEEGSDANGSLSDSSKKGGEGNESRDLSIEACDCAGMRAAPILDHQISDSVQETLDRRSGHHGAPGGQNLLEARVDALAWGNKSTLDATAATVVVEGETMGGDLFDVGVALQKQTYLMDKEREIQVRRKMLELGVSQDDDEQEGTSTEENVVATAEVRTSEEPRTKGGGLRTTGSRQAADQTVGSMAAPLLELLSGRQRGGQGTGAAAGEARNDWSADLKGEAVGEGEPLKRSVDAGGRRDGEEGLRAMDPADSESGAALGVSAGPHAIGGDLACGPSGETGVPMPAREGRGRGDGGEDSRAMGPAASEGKASLGADARGHLSNSGSREPAAVPNQGRDHNREGLDEGAGLRHAEVAMVDTVLRAHSSEDAAAACAEIGPAGQKEVGDAALVAVGLSNPSRLRLPGSEDDAEAKASEGCVQGEGEACRMAEDVACVRGGEEGSATGPHSAYEEHAAGPSQGCASPAAAALRGSVGPAAAALQGIVGRAAEAFRGSAGPAFGSRDGGAADSVSVKQAGLVEAESAGSKASCREAQSSEGASTSYTGQQQQDRSATGPRSVATGQANPQGQHRREAPWLRAVNALVAARRWRSWVPSTVPEDELLETAASGDVVDGQPRADVNRYPVHSLFE